MTINKKSSHFHEPARAQYLIIGSGRLASHLARYFRLLDLSFKIWNRSQSFTILQDLLASQPIVLLAISDSALESFYHENLQGHRVIHFSGALNSEHMISCHPLMTFGPSLYDLETYKNIYFGITGAETLADALPGLSNSYFQLKKEDKALYHALCVLTSAGAQTIWNLTQELAAKAGVPAPAFKPFIRQTAENYLSLGRAGMTGPWVRHDEKTISRNLAALKTKSDSLARVYETLKEGSHDNS
jgi:predicted short-subunit dehydrogenase-like oxidoreductase (DUF2520 family)